MSKLSLKIILTLLPLAGCILLFGTAYYNARITIIMDHALQSSKLAVTQGTRDIAYYIDHRFNEFDRLSVQMDDCLDSNLAGNQQLTDALAYTTGFSLLLQTDLQGDIQLSSLSANKSNRYVLRQDLTGIPLLKADAISLLTFGYHDWLQTKPKLSKQEQQVRYQLRELKNRGEENSITSRRLRNKLMALRSEQSLPKAVITLLPSETVEKLGLIFEGTTHIISRPMVNCQGDLSGYYAAVIDKTQFEDRLYDIKQSMLEGQLEHVDLGLIRNHDQKLLTPTRYLSQSTLNEFPLNQSDEPEMRSDIGGILMNRVVPVDFSQRSVVIRDPEKQANGLGISLFAFITHQDLEKQRIGLIREVSLYVLVMFCLFLALALYLSHYIAAPIQILRKRVKAMEQGKLTAPPSLRRYDEIGSLYQAFNQMASTLKNKEAQLMKLAHNDELTGILNRRALLEQAKQLRYSDSMTAVCMMDLDHFKKINDDFGHAVGDETLVRFCQLVSKELKAGQIFGRLGGEEFALLLPDMDTSMASLVAEHIRSLTETSLYLSLPANANRIVTVSIGITLWTSGDINKALAAADHCLYQAKHLGRNKVVAC